MLISFLKIILSGFAGSDEKGMEFKSVEKEGIIGQTERKVLEATSNLG